VIASSELDDTNATVEAVDDVIPVPRPSATDFYGKAELTLHIHFSMPRRRISFLDIMLGLA